MQAKDAKNGVKYKLKATANRDEVEGICEGWNSTGEWVLFLYYDKFGARKITMLMPQDIIETV